MECNREDHIFNIWRGVLTDEKEVLDVIDDGCFDDRSGGLRK